MFKYYNPQLAASGGALSWRTGIRDVITHQVKSGKLISAKNRL